MRFAIAINPVGQMRARHGTIRTKSGKIISKTFKHDTQVEREETLAANQNALTGREREEKPVYIGDVEKAKAIHAQGKLTELPAGEGMRHVSTGLSPWVRPIPERQ